MTRDWSIKNIYFYLVCLVTLFLIVAGFISTVSSTMQLTLPEQPNVPLMFVYYPEFRENQPVFDPPPLAKLEEMRREQELQSGYYQVYTLRQLLNAIALLIIPIPFFIYHWKQVKPGKGG